jgi:hypothetical protein
MNDVYIFRRSRMIFDIFSVKCFIYFGIHRRIHEYFVKGIGPLF